MQGSQEASTSSSAAVAVVDGHTQGPSSSAKKPSLSPLLALLHNTSHAVLIKQGAEAKVYKVERLFSTINNQTSVSFSSYTSTPCLLKYRFQKAYRHKTLDIQLTKSRISHEAKCLAKCKRAGVDVPAVRAVDIEAGILLLEWIEGHGSVREVLGGLPENDGDNKEAGLCQEEVDDLDVVQGRLERFQLSRDAIMRAIGQSIGKMHLEHIIHGDLTTSNMLLRSSNGDVNGARVVLIDFGLSYVSTLVEDKAVDLYVLERAMSSTHPEAEDLPKSERNIEKVLSAYASQVGSKQWALVERRLKDVRLRGRKRSMIG